MTDRDRVYERFQLIANGPALFNALVTATDLDIFGYLSAHPDAEFTELQEFTGLEAHKLRVLLLGLCATELVTRNGDRYANHPVAEELLAPETADSWRHTLRSWHRLYYPAFYRMTQALQAGTNATLSAHDGDEPTLYERLAHDAELEKIFHDAMAAFTLRTMAGLLDGPGWASARHLLDVGGGNGTNAQHLARRHPDLRVTVLDLPSVVGLARESLPEDLAGRVEFLAGDMFELPFPQGPNTVLFSHLLDTVSEAQARELIGKAYTMLPPGGRIVIYGFMADDDERGGVIAARLSLYLNVLATGRGMAWPARDCADWLRHAGCADVTVTPDLPYEHALVVGTKP
ncbi:methyltransferase [Streptosporangium sp. NPDC051023]|uniref:methyltransferase n=1 Tax=Streptosporangium sp. NPDC051023 TaxID=3155410 RepID=UPI0034507A4B